MLKLYRLLVLSICVVALASGISGWAESEEPNAELEEIVEPEDTTPAPSPPPDSKARLEALQPEFTFTPVHSTDVNPITHSFVFRNAGEETLVISKIRPSCGCTSAIASATQIAPGATASLTAALTPKGRSGNQSITVHVSSNDPTNPSQVFRMSGTILMPWRVMPVLLDMGPVGKAQTVIKNVTLTSQYMRNEAVHRVTHIKVQNPSIQAATTESPAPRDNKDWFEVDRVVRVKVTAGSTEGEQSHRVLIATDDPQSPTHIVTVRWSVEGDLAVMPTKVFVSDVKSKKVSRDLTISSRSSTPFDITSVELQGSKGNDDLTLTLKPNATPTRKVYTVTPNVKTERATDTRSGKIILKTTNPEQPVLAVPYTVVVRR